MKTMNGWNARRARYGPIGRRPAAEHHARPLIAACEDCGLPYSKFPLDTVLPDEQWLLIHPTGLGGLLCAGCIARRVAALPETIIVHARIIFARDHDLFRACKNLSNEQLFAPGSGDGPPPDGQHIPLSAGDDNLWHDIVSLLPISESNRKLGRRLRARLAGAGAVPPPEEPR